MSAFFLTPEFIETWNRFNQKSHQNEKSANLIHTLHPHLPLILKQPLGFNILETFGKSFVDYLDFSTPSLFEHLISNLTDSRVDWDLLICHKIALPPTSVLQLQSNTLNKNGFRVHSQFIDKSPFLSIGTNWDEFYNKKGKKSRYNLRRSERQLNDIGELEILHCNSVDAVKENLGDAFDIYRRRWHGRSIHARRFYNSAWLAFYRELAIIFAEKGQMDLVFCKVGGKPIAFGYGLIAENKYHLYLTATDPDPIYAKHSPGKVLMKHSIQFAFEKELDEFDFMLGNEPYKAEWTKNSKSVYYHLIGKDTCKSKISFNLSRNLLALSQKVKHSKSIRTLANKLSTVNIKR